MGVDNMLDVIKDRSLALLDNYKRAILAADLNFKLYNQPLSKHIYHALYWFDYWFCAPENFTGASFHIESLESLDVCSGYEITQQDLLEYHKLVKLKTIKYLDNLTAAMLQEIAADCEDKTRFACILGQFAHSYAHIGNVNSVTIAQTNKWVNISCRECDADKPLFDL